MVENRETQLTTISKAKTIEEIGEFWDNHSLDDYWDQTHEVDFEVRVKRNKRVTLEPEVYNGLEVQAQKRGLRLENLLNLWLTERLALENAA